jgi:hypothetical protein
MNDSAGPDAYTPGKSSVFYLVDIRPVGPAQICENTVFRRNLPVEDFPVAARGRAGFEDGAFLASQLSASYAALVNFTFLEKIFLFFKTACKIKIDSAWGIESLP